MVSNYRVPPTFEERKPYESWKNEVNIWTRVTDLEKKKQALAVALALSGRARDTAMEIPVDDLNKDTGMTTLFAKLDDLFLKEEKDRIYEAYSDFDRVIKEANMSMADYIIDFEQRYSRMKKYNMELPDAVLAFKLLDTACLDITDRQLALTACSDVTFASMKSALKRIFGEKRGAAAEAISQESVFATEQRRQKGKYWRQSPRQETTQPGTNPLDKYGRRSKCAVCQSTFHWVKNCPHKADSVKIAEDAKDVEECNLTLYTKESPTDAEIFMTECFGSAIIDTACTRTVCGQEWLDNYSTVLQKKSVKIMKETETQSHRPFKFGDGKIVYSIKKVKLPAKIGNTKCNIETEVVPANIPLLLSKASLKRAGTVLDMERDSAVMFNQPVKLDFTSSGHYCVNIVDSDNRNFIHSDKLLEATEEEILTATDKMNTSEKMKVLEKLHKQFGHASADKIQRLLTNSGNKDTECDSLLKKVVNQCEVCQKYCKTKPKPAVGLPLASTYNETVAVDLHELEPGVWYLHIIDQFTRFSAGSVLTTKRSSEIVKRFIHDWISVHGPPQKLFSDNGGEFNNEEVRDMAENFNIEVKTTPAYSPWSNGLLERHNQTLTEILLKVKASTGCDWSTAMDWALMAKNSMQSVHGYSPHQLVFGQNPNLPSVLIDKVPALEGTTKSEWVAKHISALHAARKAFTEAECSERIRRALKKQLRPIDDRYETGDKVFYKRVDCPEWKGPGVVIGQDGAVVFVRHGGTCVRVHQLRLRKVTHENEAPQITCNEENIQGQHTVDIIEENGGGDTIAVSPENYPLPAPENTEAMRQHTGNTIIKTGQIVTFRNAEGVSRKAKVLGRAGKATGKYKNWFNLELLEPAGVAGNSESADLSQLEDLHVQADAEDTDTHEDVFVSKDMSFDEAKENEIKSWKQNQVFEEIEDKGQKCVSTRWVCTLKETENGIIPKARLVARGFEELQVSDLQKDSPTCASESLRLLVAVICQKQWELHSMDIKSAFLQGMQLSRDIFIKPPPEANRTGVLWKLRKCVYGLADASLYWYNRVKTIMIEAGGVVSKVDPAVFYWLDEHKNVTGVLACHVDDFIWGGSHMFSESVIPHLRSKFSVGCEAHNSFSYVGVDLVTKGKKVQIHQETYIQHLQSIHLSPSRAAESASPLTEKETEQLRSKIGQLLWVARQSRPDVMFDASNLASRLKHATVQTINEANRVVCKLKAKSVELNFQHLGEDSNLRMVTFTDASFGNLSDGGTQGGHFIVLMGDNGQFSPISWQSKRIKRIVRSTLAGETLAMSEGIDNAIFLSTLFSELSAGSTACPPPIMCVTDNFSLVDALKSTKFVTEKRLRLEISSIKELIQTKKVQVLWSQTKDQLADCFTKKGASTTSLLKALYEGHWILQ
uniref:Integrase catalytic domain-containing protein n=1 Tax=Xiphophorus maculatus TaxID=8083 RepID=M4AZE1_XIPMA